MRSHRADSCFPDRRGRASFSCAPRSGPSPRPWAHRHCGAMDRRVPSGQREDDQEVVLPHELAFELRSVRPWSPSRDCPLRPAAALRRTDWPPPRRRPTRSAALAGPEYFVARPFRSPAVEWQRAQTLSKYARRPSASPTRMSSFNPTGFRPGRAALPARRREDAVDILRHRDRIRLDQVDLRIVIGDRLGRRTRPSGR